MSDTKKNTLAELAEDLEEIVRDTKSDFYTTAISKAQRIVAELAKVDSTYVADPVNNNICNMAYNALVEIRAIAEEGAGDGK